MGPDKGKKAKIAATDDDKSVDGDLIDSIEKIQEIQDELEKIDEEASEKVLEVEQKYKEIRGPIYDKRYEIIKTIPDFWQTAFMSHPTLVHLLSEDDQKVFKYLKSLDVIDFKDVKSGYSITFCFDSNPYFENEKLVKTIALGEDGVPQLTGTNIKWKEGMNIANGIQKKKAKKRALAEESFFTFFSDHESLSEVNGFQDEVAEMIKEDLWANPLKYFNNEGEEDDEGDDDEDVDEENGIIGEGSLEDISEEEDGEDEEDD